MTDIDVDNLKIASPCSASWEDMAGDERARFCGDCERNVYNVAELSRAETESLIQRTEGRVCLRLYQRRDGTVITADCPLGRRRKWMVAAAATTAAATAAAAGLGWMLREELEVMEPMMGDIAPMPLPEGQEVKPTTDDIAPAPPHDPDELQVIMGEIRPRNPSLHHDISGDAVTQGD
jgi:hypothetical protein